MEEEYSEILKARGFSAETLEILANHGYISEVQMKSLKMKSIDKMKLTLAQHDIL